MIPQYYPVEDGKIYAGEYPGDVDPDCAEARLAHLVGAGIRTFVDLTAPADRMPAYDGLLVKLAEKNGVSLEHISIPIDDMGIPRSPETMRSVMDAIRNSRETSGAIYVHCWAGIGRTGTAIGCWLRESGYDAQTALERVQDLYSRHMQKAIYNPESPQTAGQKNYVRGWIPAETARIEAQGK